MSFSPVPSATVGCSDALPLHSHRSAGSPLSLSGGQWKETTKCASSFPALFSISFVICLLTYAVYDIARKLTSFGDKVVKMYNKSSIPEIHMFT